MLASDLITVLRKLAPEALAETWDKVGLQVGDASWKLRKPRVLLCIDLTAAVMAEAVARDVSMIVAYHPPIFEPVPTLLESNWKQRILMEAVSRRIAIYSPHTALDAAPGGINDWLCESALPGVLRAVGPFAKKGAVATGGSIRAIRPANPTKKERPYKLVTFVPSKDLPALAAALFEAGAGSIGDYDQCSFSVEGEGTFRGGDSTNPTIGQRGRLERVVERRFETILPAHRLASVMAALMRAHPYEEPAFDLIRLDLPPASGGEGVGQGRVVELDKPIQLADWLGRLKRLLGVKHLEVATPRQASAIRRIGFCAGAGGSLMDEAGPIDAFFTGEVRHHQALAARESGRVVVLAGHSQTERPYLAVYRRHIEKLVGPALEIVISREDQPPTQWR